jgi:hypothetical protein
MKKYIDDLTFSCKLHRSGKITIEVVSDRLPQHEWIDAQKEYVAGSILKAQDKADAESKFLAYLRRIQEERASAS